MTSESGVDTEATVESGAEGGSDESSTPEAGTEGGEDSAADAASEASVLFNYTFDTTTQGWTVLSASDATSDNPILTSSTLAWTGAIGSPTPPDGALEASMPFYGSAQGVQIGFRPSPALDLTGRVITAQVYLVSGLSTDPSNPGGIVIFAQDSAGATTPYDWINSTWQNLDSTNAGQWITITLDITAAVAAHPTFDPTHVGAWGIQISTGGGAMAPFPPAVVDIDSVTVQ